MEKEMSTTDDEMDTHFNWLRVFFSFVFVFIQNESSRTVWRNVWFAEPLADGQMDAGALFSYP